MAAIDIIQLDDAKAQLNIVTNTHDKMLQSMISAASRMWVNRCGPVNTQTFDEWYDGGNPRIIVRNSPIVTITRVEEVIGAVTYTLNLQTLQPGGDLSAWGYSVENTIGQLTRRAAGIAMPFTPGINNVHVAYTAGYTAIPEDIALAVTLLVQHLWETTRGAGRRPGQGGDDQWSPQLGYAWPHRVEEIAASYRTPGIA
ncbi:head-tail connector protein [Leifsonia xyli]|nr:head-tail connector protein [Leifsonia xyli]